MGNKKKLINDLLNCIDGGVEVAASYLGLSISAFNDRRYENKGTRFFSGDELLALQNLSKTALVAEFYAEQAGCLVVTKMKAEQLENFDLYMMSLEAAKANGAVATAIHDAIANDGVIDEQEAEDIRNKTDVANKLNRTLSENTINLHKKATN